MVVLVPLNLEDEILSAFHSQLRPPPWKFPHPPVKSWGQADGHGATLRKPEGPLLVICHESALHLYSALTFSKPFPHSRRGGWVGQAFFSHFASEGSAAPRDTKWFLQRQGSLARAQSPSSLLQSATITAMEARTGEGGTELGTLVLVCGGRYMERLKIAERQLHI